MREKHTERQRQKTMTVASGRKTIKRVIEKEEQRKAQRI